MDVNCREIWDELWGNPLHRLCRFNSLSLCPFPSLILFYSSLPSHFFVILLVIGLSLSLFALSLSLSTLAHSWHEASIFTPWNMERALMNCLQVSSTHASSSRGTGSGLQEGCSGWEDWPSQICSKSARDWLVWFATFSFIVANNFSIDAQISMVCLSDTQARALGVLSQASV